MFTVKQLIEELSKFPDDAVVFVEDNDQYPFHVERLLFTDHLYDPNSEGWYPDEWDWKTLDEGEIKKATYVSIIRD